MTTISRPPFDPELDAMLAMFAGQLPVVTLDNLEEFRACPYRWTSSTARSRRPV